MWTKIKAFVKKYWGYFVAFLGGVASVFLATRRTRADFRELRATYDELAREHQQLIQQADRLRVESQQAGDALEGLREELELDTVRVAEARGDVEQIEGDIDDLRDTNKRLREWLSKYGEAVEDI